MVLDHESAEQPNPREIIFDRYGIYLVTDQDAYPLVNGGNSSLDNQRNVVLVSQPDWSATLDVLKNTAFGKTIVLTPELITIAGQQLTPIHEHRAEVERALARVSQISQAKPEATFIIGSPHFVDGKKYPFNAAIVFKDGQITQVAHKRLLGGEELAAFVSDPEDLPTAVDGSTVLVCRDLIAAGLTRLIGGRNGVSDYVQTTTGDANLAKRFTKAQFIAPKTERILVQSCWGIGAPEGTINQLGAAKPTAEDVNNYYLLNLRVHTKLIFRIAPNIKQIVVCDRAPFGRNNTMVASKPMSAVFFKQ